jgi:hypothetical protein
MDSKSDNETVIPGHMILGDKPMDAEHLARLQRELSGIAPEGAIDIPVVVPDDVLPFLQVAQAAVGRHVGDLKATLAHVERELSQPPFGANGQPNQYLADRHNGLRETAERIRAEIESIGSWSDNQVRLWASEHGIR